jgi:exonuclease III
VIRITAYFSIIILNVNGLNSVIKRHRLADLIKKQDANIFCLQKMYFTDKYKLIVKGWKKDFPSKWTLKASKRSHFKTKLFRRDKEVHFILLKGTIQQ